MVHDLKLLIGKTGLTKTDLPLGGTGVVLIASDTWNATADEIIRAGEKVVVTGVEGLKVHVRRS
jgi:membrane protein implicated in regulation of membrane protease activity